MVKKQMRFMLPDASLLQIILFEPAPDKTDKMACAPREDSDQSGHAPSLIRVFAVRSVG